MVLTTSAGSLLLVLEARDSTIFAEPIGQSDTILFVFQRLL
jgi:hypothetical protein